MQADDTQEPVRVPQQVQERLQPLNRLGQSDLASRRRIKLMLDVLEGIASGSVDDPSGMAAAVVAGIDRKKLLGARLYPAEFLNDIDSAAVLIRKAESIADKAVVQADVLDYLYQHSRDKRLSRSEWERAVRTAQSIDSIIRASHRRPRVEAVMSRQAIDGAFGNIKAAAPAPKGTLMLTFHGAFVIIAQELFKKEYEQGLILSAKGFIRGRVQTEVSYRDALFTSLRSLQNGGAVLMAPDGMQGRRYGQYSVLGAPFFPGEGAAFLAYAANCNTVWYTVVRDGDRFVPVVEAGPGRTDGETLNRFSERLFSFYAEKIAGVFAGDPFSIVLLGMWAKPLQEAARHKFWI